MARKRVTGRARSVTKESRFLLTLDKVNRKLKQLDKNQVYGTYSTKKMLKQIQKEGKINYKRDRQEKIKVDVDKLSASQLRYYQKVFESFLKSKTSSPIGLKEVRTKTRESLKDTLGQISDKEISDQDVDKFYELVADEDFRYLADKIGDSEMYILIEYAKDNALSEDSFVNLIEQYMTVNNEDVRNIASDLYNKFVRG